MCLNNLQILKKRNSVWKPLKTALLMLLVTMRINETFLDVVPTLSAKEKLFRKPMKKHLFTVFIRPVYLSLNLFPEIKDGFLTANVIHVNE